MVPRTAAALPRCWATETCCTAKTCDCSSCMTALIRLSMSEITQEHKPPWLQLPQPQQQSHLGQVRILSSFPLFCQCCNSPCLPGDLRKECAYLWLQVLCSTHYSIALQVTYVFPAVAYITILTEYSETFVHCLYHAFCQFNLHW